MKLLIKYTGKRYRVTIDINQNCLIKDLKKEIEIKCRLTCIGFRLLYTIIPNYKVLLTDSFPLSFLKFLDYFYLNLFIYINIYISLNSFIIKKIPT